MWQSLKNIYHGLSALSAALRFGLPGKKIHVIGVTGTDGKTTTTHLIHFILKSGGKKASMISSVYAEIAGKQYDTGFHVTTPDPWQLQKLLLQAVEAGDEFMVLEVTSHGLDQNRVWGIPFEIGVITNVSHEHLDYHSTSEAYLRTKEKLLQSAKIAVINKDDESYHHFNLNEHRQVITYGLKQADISLTSFPFETQLPGEYNKFNCLAAIAVCKQLRIPEKTIRQGIQNFPGVKGRFEFIESDKGFDVIIDFAHTPNAIEKVLSTLKPLVKGKLIHVFGSAGLRDHKKRPIMGEKSATYADIIVITEEDYRTEDVNTIISQITQGCEAAGARERSIMNYRQILPAETPIFFRIPNREKAIRFAIQNLAHNGDTVIFTGKAHEKSLCRGTTEYPWSEHDTVDKALNELQS